MSILECKKEGKRKLTAKNAVKVESKVTESQFEDSYAMKTIILMSNSVQASEGIQLV